MKEKLGSAILNGDKNIKKILIGGGDLLYMYCLDYSLDADGIQMCDR